MKFIKGLEWDFYFFLTYFQGSTEKIGFELSEEGVGIRKSSEGQVTQREESFGDMQKQGLRKV